MDTLSPTRRRQLDDFLAAHEVHAYGMAFMLTQNRDDALELVQDSMLRLVQKYRHKPPDEWRVLLYRILQNCIRDFHRRQSLRKLVYFFSHDDTGDDHQCDQQDLSNSSQTPPVAVQQIGVLEKINKALTSLPLRQQQTFLLRAWQEFSTRETAFALSISEGSVKTHYNRARQRLQQILGDEYEAV
ncbi:MAG: RNA polymerase sigma factor [Gammaproteobacteria bacterium]|nr:RNA polymerase sigma factor [Gammaproteobacteria bacterium]